MQNQNCSDHHSVISLAEEELQELLYQANNCNSQKKQYYLDKAYKLIAETKQKLSQDHTSEEFFKNEYPWINKKKELTSTLLKILLRKFPIKYNRTDYRYQVTTYVKMNENWNIFYPALNDLKIEKINEDDPQSDYKLEMLGETYYTNADFKIKFSNNSKANKNYSHVQDIKDQVEQLKQRFLNNQPQPQMQDAAALPNPAFNPTDINAEPPLNMTQPGPQIQAASVLSNTSDQYNSNSSSIFDTESPFYQPQNDISFLNYDEEIQFNDFVDY